MNEFDLIKHYLARDTVVRSDVLLGIGDDGALLEVPADKQVSCAIHTIAGLDLHGCRQSPNVLGYRLLEQPLHQLLALQVVPRWATLSLTLPEADQSWLREFCRAFFALADLHGIALVGGDTTRGALLMTTVVHGLGEFD